tara:strand:+ start:4157 stop:4273 length:117 start_codon:yes stop_codon:yes gene_type:complete
MKVKDLKKFIEALEDEQELEIIVDDKPRYIIKVMEEEE